MSTEEEEIAYDPIIAFYLKIAESNNVDGENPLFSETMLRLSFKEVFGPVRPLFSEELSLYRKLLVLHYATNYICLGDITSIMTCFDEKTVLQCFNERNDILTEWHNYFDDKLTPIIYREALNEIIYEYAIRYKYLMGQITKEQVKEKVNEIQNFLNCNPKMPRQFYTTFNAVFANKLTQAAKSGNYEKLTEADLNLINIFNSVMDKLNYFVVQRMSDELSYESVENEPPSKKLKSSQHDDVINTSIEIINPSSSVDNTKIQSVKFNIKSTQIDNTENYENDNCELDIIEVRDENEYSPEINEESQEIYINLDESNVNDNVQAEVENIEIADNEVEIIDDVVDYDTALRCLEALKVYAEVNQHVDAIELLDNVNSIFGSKFAEK